MKQKLFILALFVALFSCFEGFSQDDKKKEILQEMEALGLDTATIVAPQVEGYPLEQLDPSFSQIVEDEEQASLLEEARAIKLEKERLSDANEKQKKISENASGAPSRAGFSLAATFQGVIDTIAEYAWEIAGILSAISAALTAFYYYVKNNLDKNNKP